MTEFTQYIFSQYSTLHLAFFENKGVEYQVNLQRISAGNAYDASLIFPENYLFSPRGCNALADVYIRMINRRLGKGTTLESGLDPDRRGYVIRTQTCYQRES